MHPEQSKGDTEGILNGSRMLLGAYCVFKAYLPFVELSNSLKIMANANQICNESLIYFHTQVECKSTYIYVYTYIHK